ncbi:hypothetical protein Pan216_37080 [Planctomycetes bacterium Pan216]|uniref:Uncharacterized protein n=1 Tax=Kolteria novifilia TaxID=2527975 RepID=A0A518B796_9BACT|nr:hypothetical protein Pan216_37080 [Planctomycetes bacterium Pan216]
MGGVGSFEEAGAQIRARNAQRDFDKQRRSFLTPSARKLGIDQGDVIRRLQEQAIQKAQQEAKQPLSERQKRDTRRQVSIDFRREAIPREQVAGAVNQLSDERIDRLNISDQEKAAGKKAFRESNQQILEREQQATSRQRIEDAIEGRGGNPQAEERRQRKLDEIDRRGRFSRYRAQEGKPAFVGGLRDKDAPKEAPNRDQPPPEPQHRPIDREGLIRDFETGGQRQGRGLGVGGRFQDRSDFGVRDATQPRQVSDVNALRQTPLANIQETPDEAIAEVRRSLGVGIGDPSSPISVIDGGEVGGGAQGQGEGGDQEGLQLQEEQKQLLEDVSGKTQEGNKQSIENQKSIVETLQTMNGTMEQFGQELAALKSQFGAAGERAKNVNRRRRG